MKMVVGASLIATVLPMKAIEAQTNNQLVTVELKNYIGNPKTVNVVITGDYYLSGHENLVFSGTYVLKKSGNGTIELRSADQKKTIVLESGFTLIPKIYDTDNAIQVNNITYLGNMQFTLNGDVIRPTNTLSMEDYLKGVVPYEMENSWELEAQKAQAVAARTYALSQRKGVIDDTTQYQVYKGYDATKTRSIQAVSETEGNVLTSNGQYISALYSATNGGWQTSNTNVWGTPLVSYLPSKPDPYSIDAGKHLNWWFSLEKKQIDTTTLDLTKPNDWWGAVSETTVDKKQITDIKTYVVDNKLLGVSSVNDFKITEILNISYDTPPYVATKRLTGSVTFTYFLKKKDEYVMENGEIKTHTAKIERDSDDMRVVFQSSQISPHIQKVEETKTTFKVIGSGYGHGVGMSQWGAQQMAKVGKNYAEILAHYYEGTTLETKDTDYKGVIPAVDSIIVTASEKEKEETEIPSGVKTHVVIKGDTRYSVSQKFGITVDQLTEWSKLTNPILLSGQVLVVSDPSKVTTPKEELPVVMPPKETPIKDTKAPAEVSGFKTTVEVDAITLIFTKPKDVDFSHVEILRNGLVVNKKGTTTTFTDTGLKENTTYSYVVKTVDKTGNKSKGAIVTVTTKKKAVNNATTYTVKKGDSLSAIAKKYGTTYQNIMNWNKLKTTTIYVGQTLQVSNANQPVVKPTPTPPAPTINPKKTANVTASVLNMRSGAGTSYKVVAVLKKNQVVTVNSVAGKWANVTYGSKKGYVSTDYLVIATTTGNAPTNTAKPVVGTMYTVKPGDTLFNVAKKYNTNVSTLKSWNKLTSNVIRTGQILTVKK